MHSTDLSSPRGLAALGWLLGDPRRAIRTSHAFRTWEELFRAAPVERAQRLGEWAAALRVPAAPPVLDVGPADELLTPFSSEFPTGLRDLPEHPLVVARAGVLPTGPVVHIALPNPASADVLGALPLVLGLLRDLGFVVALAVNSESGIAALRAAQRCGTSTVAILSAPPHLPGCFGGRIDLDTLVDQRSVLLWEVGLLDRASDELADRSEYLATAMSAAVLLLELAPGRRGGVAALRAAGALPRPLFVPTHNFGDRISHLLTTSLRRCGSVARSVFGLPGDMEVHSFDLDGTQ